MPPFFDNRLSAQRKPDLICVLQNETCIHAWSNLTLRWTKSSVSGGVQKAQSVGALQPHHSAQLYDSGLAQEKELCIQQGLWAQHGHGSSSSPWCWQRWRSCRWERSRRSRTCGERADATAVAEHALALVPVRRSRQTCAKSWRWLSGSTAATATSHLHRPIHCRMVFTHGTCFSTSGYQHPLPPGLDGSLGNVWGFAFYGEWWAADSGWVAQFGRIWFTVRCCWDCGGHRGRRLADWDRPSHERHEFGCRCLVETRRKQVIQRSSSQLFRSLLELAACAAFRTGTCGTTDPINLFSTTFFAFVTTWRYGALESKLVAQRRISCPQIAIQLIPLRLSATAAFRLQNMRAQEQLDVLPTQGQGCAVRWLASGRTWRHCSKWGCGAQDGCNWGKTCSNRHVFP